MAGENDGTSQPTAGSIGAPEGAPAATPSEAEIKELYEATGVKAPVPTGKAKGRPKSDKVRAEDVSDDDDGDSKSGRKDEKPSKGKSKDAQTDGKDGDSGDDSDPKGSKKRSDSGKVSDESEEADDSVRKSESGAKKDSKSGSEEDADDGADGTGQAADKSSDSEEEESDVETGKRPGKSNPEVEKRFQRLTEEKRAAEARAEELEKKLQETSQKQAEARIAQEDPEYTIDDFRKVRDTEGNIIDLDSEKAELAWRRWKEGYDGRAAEREAKSSYEARVQEQTEETQRELMQRSADAYDALDSLMGEYPELVSDSGKFDKDFAADAMPIINEAIQYLEGTEPGNEEGNLPVIVGLKIDPKKILAVLKKVNDKKRSLPLNGVNDNVDSRSNVSVPHSRSSDPTVNAANQLMKELKIDKRF